MNLAQTFGRTKKNTMSLDSSLPSGVKKTGSELLTTRLPD